MARPSFQFYPADWRSNAKLRLCSEAARGCWIDILCVLHDSDEYGVVRWPLTDLARVAGVPLKLARELSDKGVLRGADSGAEPYIFTPYHAGQHGEPVVLVNVDSGSVWFSSRMVRDEWIRHRRGKNTRFSSENQPPKPTPMPSPKGGIGERQGDGPSSSSSSSESKKDTLRVSPSKSPKPPIGDFESFWLACPRKVGKGAARRAYAKALMVASPDALLAGMRRYAASRKGEPEEFTAHPATWLNQERWLDGPANGGGSYAVHSTEDEQRAEHEARIKAGVISDVH